MASFLELFNGRSDGDWHFDLEPRFNGGFGGTNGGVLSAISVYVARQISGRRPASIDSHFLRGFRPGVARINVETVNEGRTLSVLNVDLFDAEDRLCTRSVVSLVEQQALAEEISLAGQLSPPADLLDWTDGKVWREPPGQKIPLIETFQPRALGGSGQQTTTATRLLWSEQGLAAEASCIAADISVGPPVARGVRGKAAIPNPNLSLRFCGVAEPDHHLLATCELISISAGLASTSIQVWADTELLAVGISSTTCLPLSR